MQVPEARPEGGGEINGDSRTREELTVVHNMDSPDIVLNDQLKEKTDRINAPNYSEGGFMGNKFQATINSPQNPGNLNAGIIGINEPEISGGNCSLLPTAQIGINPIHDQSKSTSSNQVKTAAQINPSDNVFTPNSKAREGHESDKRRNQIRVGNLATSLEQLAFRAQQQLHDYKRMQPMRIANTNANLHTAANWTPPHTPFLKINYNGVIFRDDNSAGIGVVIRDSEGGVLASLAENIPLLQTVAEVEAAAVRRAVTLAKDLQFNSYHIRRRFGDHH
ncbi:hypothetical protein CMV_006634 [Castanea mollissima]|uniref:RNase H type-1 domain-containing protein n=1 Tax=Castanea mollissima TaxID=60419 RepID=A0A8J4RQQ6_9ROSI|nr:hypothetical protein CMV_006634 [Castanea mollissima]